MSNGNESVPFKQEIIPSGPKTKHCKPRRRGGMSGPYTGGASSGSYFASTPEPSSPTTESIPLKPPNGSPSQPTHDILPDQNVESFVTPLSAELDDNLQSEMIELDTITGSREPSPSSANPSMLDLHDISMDDTVAGVTGKEKPVPADEAVGTEAVGTEVNNVLSDGGGSMGGGDEGKRKELETEEVGSADSSQAVGDALIEGESQVKKYKRQRRSVPKNEHI